MSKYTQLDISLIQEDYEVNIKKLNKLGFLYDERDKDNPVRFGVKSKWKGNPQSIFSNLRE